MLKRPFRRLFFLCVFGLVVPAGAQAQEPVWQPPAPTPRAKDWVRLHSGEWLRGEIKRLRRERLEFDSEDLDLLHLDMDDVAELRSPNLYTYVFRGRVSALGTATLRDSVLVVGTAAGPQQFARSDLLSIIPGGQRELDFWSALGHLSFVIRTGNTNQGDLTTVVRVERGGPVTRLQLSYNGNFGRVEGNKTVDNHNGNLQLDAFLSNRFYLTPIAFDIFADKFQNIDLRVSPSIGFGVTAIDNNTVVLETDLGAGYQWTRFRSVEPGQEQSTSQASIIPGMTFEWDYADNVELRADFNVRIGIPDVQDSFFHFLTIMSYDLTSAWNFEVALTWDRVQNPRADSEGKVPRQDDVRMSFGIGVEY